DLVFARKPEGAAGLLQEVAELFAPMAQDHGVTIDVSAPPADVVVDCDRERLMQVLGNLTGNALKFTPQGGRVTLRAIDRGHVVTFEVEDTGAGIAPEHLPHIFERYRSYDQRGTGLGLYIAQRLVDLHGGR